MKRPQPWQQGSQSGGATTLPGTAAGSAGGLDPAAMAVWGLTLAWHPDLSRVGERAVLPELGAGSAVALSRLEPLFAAPGGVGRPLEDRRLSRRPLTLRLTDAGLEVSADGPIAVEVGGLALEGSRRFAADALDDGLVLTFGGQVVLVLHRLDPQVDRSLPRWGLIGESLGLTAVRRAIARVADLNVPVLVRGATGTGKELVARALHAASPRRQAPFVAVNMAAIPPDLAAAELFGVERGAFTGADRKRPGFIAQAQGGTLFLDEVGETPAAIQPLLLRALDSGEIQPVGAARTERVDVRVVAATDADLEAAVAERRFRAPLLHRLRGFEIELPPLARRCEDVGPLLLAFLREELRQTGQEGLLDRVPGWLPAAVAARFVRAPWPGNIRQLRGGVRQLVVASRGAPRSVLDATLEAALAPADAPKVPASTATRDAQREPAPKAAEPRKPADIGTAELFAALSACAFRPHAAAKRLGIPRSSIYDLIARHPQLRTAADLDDAELARAEREHGGQVEAMAAVLQVSASALRRRLRRGSEGGGSV